MRYQLTPLSWGTLVRPYTNPCNSSAGRGFVRRLTTIVTTKQDVQAKIAIQKFCAIVDGKRWSGAIHPPLCSATVNPCVSAAKVVPVSRPVKAPCPVARRQNIAIATSMFDGVVIQPGGAMRDQELIDAADEQNIAMVLTGERQFRH